MNGSNHGGPEQALQTERRRGAGTRQLLAAAMLGGAGLVAMPAMAGISGVTGTPVSNCAPPTSATVMNGVKFALEAREGRISTADGGSLYAWGFAEAGKAMQYPGPTLVVNQGDCVVVEVKNLLPVYTSVIFPGQGFVNAAGGGAQPTGTKVPKMMLEVRPPYPHATTGVPQFSTATYTFIAAEPGTYMYQSGTQPDVQPEMGLQGALLVRPSAGATQAYGHASTAFNREKLYYVTEADPARRQEIETQVGRARAAAGPSGLPQGWNPDTMGWGPYKPQYWFINGRTAPDTLAAAGTDTFPHQPYNALARVHAGDRLLMRVINGGRDLHPMHHHGNHSITIARDGRMLSSDPAAGPDLAASDFTLRMVPGQTVDAIWNWTGRGLGWDISGATCNPVEPMSLTNCPYGRSEAELNAPLTPSKTTQAWSDLYKPLPTRMPAALEVTYGEMFSGSPYLGVLGARPVGAGLGNASGGYWHMFHSHNEREIVNFGIFPGGLMTMLLIEPSYIDIPVNE